MGARSPATAAVSGPPLRAGILIGCVPILIAIAAAVGFTRCPVGPMVYGYCSSAAEGTVLSIAAVALGSAAFELLVGLICLAFRRLRRLGGGLVLMALAFIPVSVVAVYFAAFVALSLRR